MPRIFDVTTNENARYKRNELGCTYSRILEKLRNNKQETPTQTVSRWTFKILQ